MNEQRLDTILKRFEQVKVLVVGDFFLDRYLIMDRRLSEVSLETGLEAYQVVGIRCSPGAAGTVAANLRALDVDVTALGVIGDDGEGYELRRGLDRLGVHREPLIERKDLFTPTYTKPMMREENGREHELNRLDTKNRAPLPAAVEDRIIEHLRTWIPEMDGVVVADQAQERNCGVITDRVREEVGRLARSYPQVVFAVDSRVRIGEFRDVIIMPNEREAAEALSRSDQYLAGMATVRGIGAELFRRNQKPVYLTVGEGGVLLFSGEGERQIPGVKVTGEIDIVGAGDSFMAGTIASLCSQADLSEAALIGNLVASITIQQIGTTGTASRRQVLERYRQAFT